MDVDRLLVGRSDDFGLEFLVTLWPDGAAEVAIRLKPSDTWSPPVPLHDEAET